MTGTRSLLADMGRMKSLPVLMTDLSTKDHAFVSMVVIHRHKSVLLVLSGDRFEVIRTTQHGTSTETYMVHDPLILETIRKEANTSREVRGMVLRHILKVSDRIGEEHKEYRTKRRVRTLRRKGAV